MPVSALVDLYEAITAERESGRRRLHVIEPAMTEARARANALRPARLIDDRDGAGPHDRAERRNRAYHAAVARHLRKSTVERALHQLWRWDEEGTIDPRYAEAWEDVLRRPLPEIKRVLTEASQQARDLRQNSPFAGALSEPERRRILDEIHSAVRRADLEHVVAAAAQIVGEDEFVVVGSQAILASHPDALASLLRSQEADVYPRNAPEKAIEIEGAIGDGSYFHQTHGYYAHAVGPETAKAPAGWEQRLVAVHVPPRVRSTTSATAFCLEPHDLILAKLAANRERDWDSPRTRLPPDLSIRGSSSRECAISLSTPSCAPLSRPRLTRSPRSQEARSRARASGVGRLIAEIPDLNAFRESMQSETAAEAIRHDRRAGRDAARARGGLVLARGVDRHERGGRRLARVVEEEQVGDAGDVEQAAHAARRADDGERPLVAAEQRPRPHQRAEPARVEEVDAGQVDDERPRALPDRVVERLRERRSGR